MPIVVTIFLVLSLIVALISPFVSNKGKETFVPSLITKTLMLILAILSAVHSISGLFGNMVLMIVFILVGVSSYLILDMIISIIFLKHEYKYMNMIKMIPSVLFYVFVLTGEFLYFGFNFVELISFSAAALIFYASIYLLKRDENTKSITIFFIYTVLVSYFIGKSVSGMILSDALNLGMEVCVPLFIGSLLVYLSNIIKDSDLIFGYTPKKSERILRILAEIISNVGVIILSLSLVFAF